MATGWYLNGLKNVLSGSVDLTSDTINAVLVDATYTPNLSTDEFLSSIDAGDRVATATLASKTITIVTTYATFDAADLTFTAVSGNPITQMAVYKDTGNPATSPLLGYFDGSGVAATPNGNNIICQWNAAGILRLS